MDPTGTNVINNLISVADTRSPGLLQRLFGSLVAVQEDKSFLISFLEHVFFPSSFQKLFLLFNSFIVEKIFFYVDSQCFFND